MNSLIKKFVAILTIAVVISSCGEENIFEPVTNDTISETGTSTNNPSIGKSYIVVLNDKNGTMLQGSAESISNDICISNKIEISKIGVNFNSLVKGFSANLTSDEVKKLKSDSRVLYIEEDKEFSVQGIVDNEPYKNKGETLQGQEIPWGITYVGGSVNANSNTGVAWVVDTGIDLDHTDLNVNTTLSISFVTSGIDKNNPDDFNGHGSHCAGIIAAKNNTIGTIGVCAGAEVIAVKVLNYRGSGYTSDIVKGLEYIGNNLKSNKLNVVNMSLGGSVSTVLDNAVKTLANKSNVKIVIAAGNNKVDANTFSPARVNHTNVYTISSHGSTGAFSTTFSNYKNAPIDFAGPGETIYSTYKDNSYKSMSGTSMATPHTAGILLANGGTINSNGTVTNDVDGVPDTKAKR